MSDDVIQRYEQELMDDPKSRAFAPLAEAYRKAGRLDEAIDVARTGLEVHPGYSAGLVVLGRALYEKGELDNAAEILQNAVSDSPENYLGQKFLGKVLMEKGENKGALKSLEAANFLSPEDEEVVRLLEDVKARAIVPETMKYEAKDTESEQEAEIVTYEQKPTTVDGVELPPLPEETIKDTFSFSGGGTLDPADVTPVPVDEIEDTVNIPDEEVPIQEMEAEGAMASIIEERDDAGQTMQIESMDELGPEAAAFIQEGEELEVQPVDLPSDAPPPSAAVEAEEEFLIEVQDVPQPGAAPEPAVETGAVPGAEAAPEPIPDITEASPETSGTQMDSSADRSSPEIPSVVEPDIAPEPAPVPELAPVPEPATVSGPSLVSEAPAAAAAPEIEFTPEPDPSETLTGQQEDTAQVPAGKSEPEPGPPQPLSEPVPGPQHAPESAPDEEEGQFSTETLADLYAQQGLVDKAVEMYRQIMDQEPGNEAVKLKLEALGAGESAGQAAPPSPAAGGTREQGSGDTLNVLEGLLENLERMKRP